MAPHTAVCFYGITRSLRHTFPSISKHVLGPARRAGPVKVYAHFFRQLRIDSARTGENGALDPDEHELLAPDWLRLEDPEHCLEQWRFDKLKDHGDAFGDGFSSMRNLVHQLHSMERVTTAALDAGAEVCIFVRPDLRYHDSLASALARARASTSDLAQLPRWQPWTGLNDRFAVCAGRGAIAAYGQRIRVAAAVCEETGSPLHSERLVKHALARSNVTVVQIGARASRVRLDGTQRYEDFARPGMAALKRSVVPRLAALTRWLGLRATDKWLAGRP